MKSGQLKHAIQHAADRFAASLREGQSELLRNYLQAVGRFHRYSRGNILLIASQKPHSTDVAGFHTWHKLGRFGRKGEKREFSFWPQFFAANRPLPTISTRWNASVVLTV
jgi:N-terminal domain of anti-restriction factor ArdC